MFWSKIVRTVWNSKLFLTQLNLCNILNVHVVPAISNKVFTGTGYVKLISEGEWLIYLQIDKRRE